MRKKYGVLTKVNGLDLLLLKYKPELFWKGVDTIGSGCFRSLSIRSIKIPKHIKAIRIGAFQDCELLESVEFEIFDGCKTLEDRINAVKENGTIAISTDAFRWCRSLERISLPVEILERDIFGAVPYIKELEVFGSVEQRALSYTSSLEKVFVLGNVEASAFSGCKNLKTAVVMGEELGQDAFNSCGLESLTFYGKQVSDYCFFSCDKLKEFKFSKNLISFSSRAFEVGEGFVLFSTNTGETPYVLTTKEYYNDKITFPTGIAKAVINDVFSGIRIDQMRINIRNLPLFAMLMNNKKELKFYRVDVSYDKKDEIAEIFARLGRENWTLVNIKLGLLNSSLDDLEKLRRMLGKGNLKERVLSYVTGELQIPVILKDVIKKFEKDEQTKYYALKLAVADPKWLNACLKQINNLELLTAENAFPVSVFVYNMGLFETDAQLVQKASSFCAEIINKVGIENFNKLATMRYKYIPKLVEYLQTHKNELIADLKKDKPLLVPMVNCFEEIQVSCLTKHFKQKQVTFEDVANFISMSEKGKESKNLEFYRIFLKHYGSKKDIVKITENALQILQYKKENGIPDHLLSSPLNEEDLRAKYGSGDIFAKTEENLSLAEQELIKGLLHIKPASKKYTAEFTSKSDIRNFEDGLNCLACSHMTGAGAGILHQIITNPAVQNIVIRDEQGVAVLKSTMYVNTDKQYAICNNIEVNTERVLHKDVSKLYIKYMAIVKLFVYRYNKEHPENPIKQVNVGANRNDMQTFLEVDRNVSKLLPTLLEDFPACSWKDIINNVYYKGDTRTGQYIIWKADENCGQ